MSDANDEARSDVLGIIDPDFQAAWDEIYGEPDDSSAGTGGEAAAGGGEGEATPPAPAEGAGAAVEQPGEQAARVVTDPADLIAGADGDGSATGEPGPAEPASGVPDAQHGAVPAAPEGAPAGSVRSHAEIAQLLPAAQKAIEDLTTKAFQAQAEQQIAEQWGPQVDQIINTPPYLLVTQEVPNLRTGQGTTTLKDTAEAEQYIKAMKHVRDSEVAKIVAAKENDVKPMMAVVQESILMFQNNQDLVPGTAEFDKELADRFAEAARPFKVMLGEKAVGYQGDVQPLINRLRSSLVAERTAAGVTQQQQQNRQQQVAAQPRADNGQFVAPPEDGPQGGITSKQGMVGGADNDGFEDDFWRAAGMAPGGLAL